MKSWKKDHSSKKSKFEVPGYLSKWNQSTRKGQWEIKRICHNSNLQVWIFIFFSNKHTQCVKLIKMSFTRKLIKVTENKTVVFTLFSVACNLLTPVMSAVPCSLCVFLPHSYCFSSKALQNVLCTHTHTMLNTFLQEAFC